MIKKPRPLARLELKNAPAHPLGERVFVREQEPESVTEGGVVIPDDAKKTYFCGTLIAAGDQACDKLYDLGVEIGDEIGYGKYAGIVEEWQHIVKDGDKPCEHSGVWEFFSKPADTNIETRACRGCGALKIAEKIIALSVDDLIFDVDL